MAPRRVKSSDRRERHTGKIPSPLFERILYETINDIVINEGAELRSARRGVASAKGRTGKRRSWRGQGGFGVPEMSPSASSPVRCRP